MPKRYNTEILDEANCVKACVSNAKVGFKRTRETCSTLRGRTVNGCIEYLNNVINKVDCVPLTRYGKRCSNTKQARKYFTGSHPCAKGKWPKSSAEAVLKVLSNIKNNAAVKNLDVNDLYIKMVSVTKAPIIHGRVYRAYGRVNPFNKKPCHIQMVCEKRSAFVAPDAELVEVEN